MPTPREFRDGRAIRPAWRSRQPRQPLRRRPQRLEPLRERESELRPPQLGPREERRARHRRHARVVDQPPGERHVVVGREPRDVGHHVVRPVRLVEPEAGLGQGRQQRVAPLPVAGDERLVVAVGHRHRDRRRLLERRRRADRQEVVGPPHADREIRSGDHPAHPPARHGVRLRHRVDRDRPVGHARDRRERDVRAVVDDVLVDLVGEREQVVLQADRGDQLQLVAAEDLAGRVVGRVDDDRPRPGPDRGAQLVGVDRPVGLVERHVARHRAREDRVGPVVLVERLEDHDLVAGVDQPEHRRDHPLGGAAHDRDVGVGARRPARMPASRLRGDRLAQRLRAPRDRVLVDVGEERGRGRLLQLLRRREVREALGEAHRAGLDREAVHLADDRFRERLGFRADPAHARECTQRARRPGRSAPRRPFRWGAGPTAGRRGWRRPRPR